MFIYVYTSFGFMTPMSLPHPVRKAEIKATSPRPQFVPGRQVAWVEGAQKAQIGLLEQRVRGGGLHPPG